MTSFPTPQEQLSLCMNTRIIQKLREPDFYISGSSDAQPTLKKDRSDKRLCDALSWIALCFVTVKTGRDVAICLRIKSKEIEFLMADNKGSKGMTGDADVVEFLRDITVRALKARIRLKETYTPNSEDVYDRAIQGMVRLNWPRIGRKIEKINSRLQKYHPEGGLLPFFNSHLDAWVAAKKASHSATEMFTQMTKLPPGASSTDGDTNVALLKTAFRALFTNTAIQNTEAAHVTFYNQFMKHCAYVENSDFLNAMISPGSLGLSDKERYPFVKLRRRIRNLAKYNEGAFLYLKEGIRYINKFVTEEKDAQKGLLQFTPIGADNNFLSTQDLTWPRPPQPALNGTDGLPVWVAGEHFHACVHCEVAMICYLERLNINLTDRVIGTSTLTCVLCARFATAVGNGMGHYWKLPNSSNKDQHGWLMVPSANNDPLKTCFVNVYNGTQARAHLFMGGN